MADDITAPGTGAVVGADLIGSTYYVRNKIILGADGVNNGDLSKANGMPLSLNTATDGSGTELRAVCNANGVIQTQLASGASSGAAVIGTVRSKSDAVNAVCKSATITLPTAGTLCTVTLPDNAQGFRLWPTTTPCRFAVGENTVAVATGSGSTFSAASFAVGGIAKNDQWETRLIADGTSRTITLLGTVNGQTVDVEVF